MGTKKFISYIATSTMMSYERNYYFKQVLHISKGNFVFC